MITKIFIVLAAFFILFAILLYTPSKSIESLEEPTLILWGKEDQWAPLENAERFNELIPDSKVVVYEDVGHVPMEEAPERSAGDALKFLSKKFE